MNEALPWPAGPLAFQLCLQGVVQLVPRNSQSAGTAIARDQRAGDELTTENGAIARSEVAPRAICEEPIGTSNAGVRAANVIMKDVVHIAPVGQEPGLIAYECTGCHDVLSDLVWDPQAADPANQG